MAFGVGVLSTQPNGPALQRIRDSTDNAVEVGDNVPVPDAHDLIAFGGEPARATFVMGKSLRPGMLTAIDLDYQQPLQADEIDDEGSQRMLPAKFQAVELPAPQSPPQQALGIGHRSAQASRTFVGHRGTLAVVRDPVTPTSRAE